MNIHSKFIYIQELLRARVGGDIYIRIYTYIYIWTTVSREYIYFKIV
jgi:hypothetical protein